MPSTQDTPESHLPLRPVELLLLTMLTAGNRHGDGLRQDILDHTGGKIDRSIANCCANGFQCQAILAQGLLRHFNRNLERT